MPDLATHVLVEVYKMADLLGKGGSCWRRLVFHLCCMEPGRVEERLPGEGRAQQYQKGSPAGSAGLGKHCCIWKGEMESHREGLTKVQETIISPSLKHPPLWAGSKPEVELLKGAVSILV